MHLELHHPLAAIELPDAGPPCANVV
jgi:hypothetical protein